ncbi:hypothetical protein SUNI508_00282 [Seiridium unicorne]|uniref:Uncharacterized protein n=1 Tax=Seiridium unicorne TaxID=138068 RepID=A0ABR2VII0_9PEZI
MPVDASFRGFHGFHGLHGFHGFHGEAVEWIGLEFSNSASMVSGVDRVCCFASVLEEAYRPAVVHHSANPHTNGAIPQVWIDDYVDT